MQIAKTAQPKSQQYSIAKSVPTGSGTLSLTLSGGGDWWVNYTRNPRQ